MKWISWDEIHRQTQTWLCTEWVTECFQLPTTACIKFHLGTGTQVHKGICCPFSPGTYPAKHASKSLVLSHCRPPSSLFMQEWSIKQTASSRRFHRSLMIQWPFSFSQNKHPVKATFRKRWQQFPEVFWMTSVYLINLYPGVLSPCGSQLLLGEQQTKQYQTIWPPENHNRTFTGSHQKMLIFRFSDIDIYFKSTVKHLSVKENIFCKLYKNL